MTLLKDLKNNKFFLSNRKSAPATLFMKIGREFVQKMTDGEKITMGSKCLVRSVNFKASILSRSLGGFKEFKDLEIWDYFLMEPNGKFLMQKRSDKEASCFRGRLIASVEPNQLVRKVNLNEEVLRDNIEKRKKKKKKEI